jgi:hypothetical protein
LVNIAIDVDKIDVDALLRVVGQIKDELWRARTIFSVFRQMRSSIVKELPDAAQDTVVALVCDISGEGARVAALRNLSSDLPHALRSRLADLGKAIADPLCRLQVALDYESEDTEQRAEYFLKTAKGMSDEEQRGQALATIAPRLRATQMEEAFAAPKAIQDPDVAELALVRIAAHFQDEERRRHAQSEIFAAVSSIANPIRKFDVLVALRELPVPLKRLTEALLFDLAAGFNDPDLRCRAMFLAGDFAEDEALQRRDLLAGIAAAECVLDEPRRSELFLLLRPGISWLAPAVRRELTRAVERLENSQIKQKLYGDLSRFFVYDREPETTPQAADSRTWVWDLFISFATADLRQARFLASELTSRGMRVFLSADVLDSQVGSVSWITAIDDALSSSRAPLVVLTEEAHFSKWVSEEWRKYYQLMVVTSNPIPRPL